MTTRTLIDRTVKGRRVEVRGGIGSNTAAQKLELLGPSVVPEIEEYISRLFKPGGAEADVLPDGIGQLLYLYFKLSAPSRHSGADEFLLALSGLLRLEALRVVFVRWGPASAGANGRLPASLARAVRHLSRLGAPDERDMAARLLDFAERTTRGPARRAGRDRRASNPARAAAPPQAVT